MRGGKREGASLAANPRLPPQLSHSRDPGSQTRRKRAGAHSPGDVLSPTWSFGKNHWLGIQ